MLIFANIGLLIAGSIFALIAIVLVIYRWKLMLVCIHGEVAVGQVIRLDVDNKSGHVHPRISFTASDGRKIEYDEPFAIRAKKGESRTIRYRGSDPYCATSYPANKLIVQVLSFAVVFAAGGVITLVGATSSVLSSGNRFGDLGGTGFFLVSGCVLLYVAFTSFTKAQSWRRRTQVAGVVKRVQTSTVGSSQYPNPWISYVTHDGRSIEYLDTQLTGYGPGGEVSVSYDPEYPESTATAIDKGSYASQAILFGLIGALLLGASMWFLWLSLAGS